MPRRRRMARPRTASLPRAPPSRRRRRSWARAPRRVVLKEGRRRAPGPSEGERDKGERQVREREGGERLRDGVRVSLFYKG